MGREVRRVPKEWQHPKDTRGQYIPLYGDSVSEAQREWDEGAAQWARGLQKNYRDDGPPWIPHDHRYPYAEWDGERPRAEDYMPDWPDAERTHWQMYENTSEGTPISPVMDSPEALARWLADNNASAFADMTATYEQWLGTIRGPGYAPSMVMTGNVMDSGVAFMAETKAKP